MRGKARFFLSLPLLILVVAIACGVVFIKSDFAAEQVCGMLRSGLADRLGLAVDIQACQIDLLPPALEAAQVRIHNQAGGRMLQADRMRVELDSLSLLAGDFQLDRVVIYRPQIHLRMVDGALVELPQFGRRSSGQTEAGTGLPGEIEIESGRLNLVVERWGLIQLREVDLRVLASLGGRLEVVSEIGGGSYEPAHGSGGMLEIKPSKCQLGLLGSRLELGHCEILLADLELKANGALSWEDGGLRSELNLTMAAPLGLAHRLWPDLPDLQGQVVLSAQTDLGSSGPLAEGVLDIKALGFKTLTQVDLQTRFKVDLERLDLSDLRITTPAGRVAGQAHLLFDASLRFGGVWNIESGDLQKSLKLGGLQWRHIDLRVNGPAAFQGQIRGKGGWHIDVQTQLAAEQLAIFGDPSAQAVVRLDQATIKADANFDAKRIWIQSARVQKGQALVEANARFRYLEWKIEGRAKLDQCPLADLGPIAGWNLDGDASLGIDVGGSFYDPALDILLHVRDTDFEGHPIGHLRGRVLLEHFQLRFQPVVLTRHGGSVRLNGSLGALLPYRVNAEAELVAIELPDLIAAARQGQRPGYLTGLVGGQISVSGSLEDPGLDFQLAFADLELGHQRFAEAGVVGRYAAGAWQLDLLEARMGPGWVFARGGISRDLKLDLTAYSTGLRADSFDRLQPTAGQLEFRLDLHLAFKGPLLAPALEGWARFYDMTVAGQQLADSHINAQASSEDFRIDGRFLGDTARLQVHARLEQGLPFDGKLTFASERLGSFLPKLAEAELPVLAAAGELVASGHLLDPDQIAADFRLDRIQASLAGVRLENRQPVQVHLKHGAFEVRQCELVGTGTSLTIRGGGDLFGGPRLEAEGRVGLGLLPLFSPVFVRAVGQANLLVQAGGSWRQPRLAGALGIQAERLRLAGLNADLESLSGQVRLTPSRIEIQRAIGRFGGGNFSVWGNGDLEASGLQRLALTIELDKVRYQASKQLWGLGSGTLNLTREPGRRLRLAGLIRTHEGGFREQISLVSLSNGLFRRRRPQARTYDRKNELVDFDVRLVVPEKFQALFNLELVMFQAEMKGDLRLTGTNERLGLVGDMSALGGSVSYLSKEFAVSSARVQFVDEFGIEPRFEIHAGRSETVDRGEDGKTTYDVDLGLLGEADNLRVALRSSPSLDERDIITLLSLGVTSRDMAQLKGDDLIGLGGEIFLRSLKADERLGQVFPFPPEVIQPKYLRMRSRYSNKARTTTPRLETGVKLRFISDDLDLDYSRSLYLDGDQSIDLSYQLSKKVSTRLRWEDTGDTDIGDLGLDLKFDWEW